jgi:hypothetical protein
MKSTNEEHQQLISFPYNEVFDAVITVIPKIDFNIKTQDRSTGLIVARTSMSLISWGENFTIFVEKVDYNNTLVGIESTSKFSGGFDRHTGNFNRLVRALNKYLEEGKFERKNSWGCLGRLYMIFAGISVSLILIGSFGALLESLTSPLEQETRVPMESLDPTPSSVDSPTTAYDPPSVPAEPKLLLLNWTWTERSGYAIVEGEVQNLSSENLHNVMVVVKFYTAEEMFITSDDALIDYNPILPGQSSPFKAIVGYNPAMQTASISFKELMGGTILWKNLEE